MAIVLPHGSHGGYSELIALPAESVVRSGRGQRRRGRYASR